MLCLSVACLKYSLLENYGYKVIAEIDKNISRYYYSLIPKYYYVQPQYYAPHISIIRKEKENPALQDFLSQWQKMDGREIKFYYNTVIYTDGVKYWWLDVFSKDIISLRRELKVSYKKTFHITIANWKHLK